jgi:glutathione S-transferase
MMLGTPAMLAVALVTVLALGVYFWVSNSVGSARGKYKIAAPAMTGHPDFERAVRVQANTLEQLVPFLAALWLAAAFSYPLLAAVLGLIWVIGRIIYALAYRRDPAKRGLGYGIGYGATIVLLLATLIGIVQRLIA